jgi:hypothetical protein
MPPAALLTSFRNFKRLRKVSYVIQQRPGIRSMIHALKDRYLLNECLEADILHVRTIPKIGTRFFVGFFAQGAKNSAMICGSADDKVAKLKSRLASQEAEKKISKLNLTQVQKPVYNFRLS